MSETARERARTLVEHELRTSLAVIIGYAELLGGRDDEALRQEAAEQILAASERLSAGLDELRELTSGSVDLPSVGADAGPQSGPANQRRILLVDDDDTIRALLRATVRSDEYSVAEARDGEEALSLTADNPFDLVLLDWNMPGSSGGEVLTELKKRHASLPVIVLTADASQRARAAELGADAFVAKPFSPLELLSALERLVRERLPHELA